MVETAPEVVPLDWGLPPLWLTRVFDFLEGSNLRLFLVPRSVNGIRERGVLTHAARSKTKSAQDVAADEAGYGGARDEAVYLIKRMGNDRHRYYCQHRSGRDRLSCSDKR